MKRCYDVTIRDDIHNRTTSFTADSFTITNDGILKIYSKQYGDVFVQLNPRESISIYAIEDTEEDEY